MIKHIVLFKFKEFAEGREKAENIRMVKSSLEALPDKIEEIRLFEVEETFGRSDVVYDLVLYSEFDSVEDLRTYQKKSDHVKVADLVGRVCEKRAVGDYEV